MWREAQRLSPFPEMAQLEIGVRCRSVSPESEFLGSSCHTLIVGSRHMVNPRSSLRRLKKGGK